MHDLSSVIIITRNRKPDLMACLASVFRQDYPFLEVTVIDNGSTDGTAEAIERNFPRVELIRYPTNRGGCVSRNEGILKARGEFIWFLDSDTEILDRTFLSSLVRTLRDHPEVGGIGGEAILDESDRIVGVKRLQLHSNGLPRGERLIGLPYGQLIHTDVLVTANLFARRRDLVAAGGFDPAYFFFAEDQDFSHRLRKLGLRTVVFGQTQVFHKFSPDNRMINYSKSVRNRTYFVIKHFPFWKIPLLPWYDLTYVFDLENFRRIKRHIRGTATYRAQAAVRAAEPEADIRSRMKPSTFLQLLRLLFGLPFALLTSYVTVLHMVPMALKLRAFGESHLGGFDPMPEGRWEESG